MADGFLQGFTSLQIRTVAEVEETVYWRREVFGDHQRSAVQPGRSSHASRFRPWRQGMHGDLRGCLAARCASCVVWLESGVRSELRLILNSRRFQRPLEDSYLKQRTQ